MISFLATFLIAAQGPLMEGSGGITSRPYENKIYDGNKVIATEWLTLEYTVTWELVDSGVWEPKGYFISCDNICQGKKHKNHAECDRSCDKACAKTHKLTMRGKYEPLRDEMRRAERESGEAARASGGTADSQDWTSASTNALQEARRMAQKLVDKKIEHWNTAACLSSTKEWGWRRWDFKIKGKFTRHIVRMESGVRTQRDEPGAEHSATVAYVWLPDEEGRNESKGINCRCFKVEIPPIQEDPGIPVWPGIGWKTDGGKEVLGGDDGCKFECIGRDLNQVECTAECDDQSYSECVIYPGTMCVPDDSSCQTMCIMRRVVIPCTHPGGFDEMFPAPTRVRAACMEISKHEPTAKIKFKLVPPSNQGVVNLATLSSKSRSLGPFDQARIWILTDQAKIEEINKRMLPGVTEGQYTNALFDVSTVGCVDLASGKYAACLGPSLLSGATASSDATHWLVEMLAAQNPKALTGYLKSDAAKFAKLLNGAPDQFDIGHTADLCDALVGCTVSDVRSAGLVFMLALPDSKRADLIGKGALDSLRVCLNSNDAIQAKRAMDVAISYRFIAAIPMIRGLAEWSKSEEIRKSAADALKKFGP